MSNSVTIVIPVKNGMPHFAVVCKAVKQQKYNGQYNVICIDSGSADGSKEVARSEGFEVIEIPSKEFGHGKTRNLGASIGNSEFIAFLTHDAIPNDSFWLQKLIDPMIAEQNVAGVFSRHIAHTDADPFIRWELEQHFLGLSHYPVVFITNREEYDANIGLQQVYHFYSDNASAMRRSVWVKHPYPDVQFAEDQIWAKTVVEAGYSKAFAFDSVVRHSHSFGPWETLQRSFDESRAFRKLFGYVLCPTIKNSYDVGVSLAKRDLANARQFGWWRTNPIKTVSRMIEGFTRPLGHYLGGQVDMPKWLADRLSRDDWIKSL